MDPVSVNGLGATFLSWGSLPAQAIALVFPSTPQAVAVGMPVTQHPPHRSRRTALPHRAPASGLTCRPPQGSAVRGRPRGTGVTRPWVRSLVCSAMFHVANSLPSTFSAGPVGRPLFEGFFGTLKLSDFLHPCIAAQGILHARPSKECYTALYYLTRLDRISPGAAGYNNSDCCPVPSVVKPRHG